VLREDLRWCPGPESNRHALRRGILRSPTPLRAGKIGLLDASCILYNILYNEEISLNYCILALRSNLFHQSSKHAHGIWLGALGQLGWFGGLVKRYAVY